MLGSYFINIFMEYKPTLLCLTGFLGSGKTTVAGMFGEYKDTLVTSNIDDIKYLKETDKKIVVYDSIKDPEEIVYFRWLHKFKNVSVVDVKCKMEERIKRVKERDNCSEISFYMRDKAKRWLAYHRLLKPEWNIYNNRTIKETKDEVYYIHNIITEEPKRLANQFTNGIITNLQNQR